MKGMLELQLTCGALHDSQIPLFVATCEQVGLRPLLIDHHHPQPHPHPHAHPHAHPDSHGHPPGGQPPQRQPSATAWLRADLEEARAEAMALAQWLAHAGVAVLDVKVDAPVQDLERFGPSGTHGEHGHHGYGGYQGRYFEWRGKLRQPNEMAALQALCKVHGAQLSRDNLRDTCFVTLRSREPQAGFDARVEALAQQLAHGGWPLLKQQSEVCLHDSRELPNIDWLAPYLLPPADPADPADPAGPAER